MKEVFKQAWKEFNELMQQEREAAAQRKAEARHAALVERHKDAVFTEALIANRTKLPKWLAWLQ